MNSMRPRFVTQHIVVAAILLAVAACTPPELEKTGNETMDATVSAGGETLRGVILDDATGLSVFRGIPFAAPPTGKRRWQPPAPHTQRPGVQEASEFGPACPQGQGNHDWYRNVAVLFGNPPETIGPLENIDEDCLYLNVWSQNLGAAEKQPVMVWIYGGANRNGYSHEPNYQGHGLAKRGIVYVSLNYRVGAMGFMAHAGLSAESDRNISGNYGIFDQIAALKWVRANIAAFGGDPDNVTIFGESAGGANTGTLTASPLGAGLFRRAISQSGGYQLNTHLRQSDAEEIGAKIAAYLGFDKPLSDVEIIDGMRELDWQAVVQGAADARAGWYTAAIIDGYLLPEAASQIFASGKHNRIDFLAGSNANENYMYMPADITREKVEEQMSDIGEPYASRMMELLADDLDSDYRLVGDRLSGAASYLCTSKFIANEIARHGGRAWFYHFTRTRPGGEKILAYHGAEIPYANDTADAWLPADEIDSKLTDTMAQYWVNFATTGSPNGEGVPEWPAYTVENGEYMELGDDVVAGTNLEADMCAILDERRTAGLAARN